MIRETLHNIFHNLVMHPLAVLIPYYGPKLHDWHARVWSRHTPSIKLPKGTYMGNFAQRPYRAVKYFPGINLAEELDVNIKLPQNHNLQEGDWIVWLWVDEQLMVCDPQLFDALTMERHS